MVVAPSLCLQKAAKSWRPNSADAASFIASTDRGRAHANVSRLCSGLTPHGASDTLYR